MIKQYVLNQADQSRGKGSLKRIFWQITAKLKITPIIKLFISKDSYLVDQGWFVSIQERKSVGDKRQPLPWLTYPLINFIEPRLNKQLSMFEYGCGNSTLWFATRVQHIRSVDHDEAWYAEVRARMPENAELTLEKINTKQNYSTITFLTCADENVYSSSISRTGVLYDIVLVDGVYRCNSVVHSVNSLKEGGVIILDNVDYVESIPATEYLENKGFRRIDFWGMCPIVHHDSCTAIFYRDGNCLNI